MDSIWSIIGKKFDGNISQDEEKALNEWIDSSTTNKQVYFQIKELWYHKQDQTNNSQAIAAYDKLINRIKFAEVIQSQSRVQRISLQVNQFVKYAAIIFFFLSFSFLSYYYITEENSKNEFCTISVPKGNKSEIVLPDGSKIWLNNNSRLVYPKKFNKSERVVELIGEGYFEVQRNTKIPFIVKTSDVSIKVLGTKFNISAYPNDKFIETTLISGKVTVQSNENPEVLSTLNPGESMTYDKLSNQTAITLVDTKFYTYWMKGEFVFRDEKFETLAKRIERIYNVEIIFEDQTLKEKTYTGDFKVDDNIYSILEIFKRSTSEPIEYITDRNTITIRKK
ncbi:MAG: FecR family protein [Sulfuricurvum sp.]|nr:FecR family protein [Sulfuricurvum sp.]